MCGKDAYMNLYSYYYDNQNSIYNIDKSILEKLKEQNAQRDMKESTEQRDNNSCLALSN
jgi:adenine C2-methylase RlmN of 23S rRNA A2503 and tRNA A37